MTRFEEAGWRKGRPIGASLAAAAFLIASSHLACAQATVGRAPVGPIEITVGASAGGTPDILMRRTAKILNDEKIIEQPIVVVNRTGGSWTVANNWVLGRKNDPNTVLGLAQPVITTPIVQGRDNVWDRTTPLGIFLQGDLVLAIQPDSPANGLADFVAAAKSTPRGVKIVGGQAGSTDQLVTGLIEKAGNVKLTFIPFDGGGTARAAFLGGNGDGIILSPDEAVALQKSGKAKIVAIFNEHRRPEAQFKDIPTATEQGIPVVWGQTWGLLGTPDLDPEVVKWWDDKLSRMVKTKAWQDMLAENFLRGDYADSAKAKQELPAIYQEHLTILRDLGISKK